MKRFLTGLIAALILLGVSAVSAQIGTPICGALVGTTINCTTVTSTGQFLGAGSASSPGFAFSATPTSGWYRRSGGSMDYSYSGVGQASFNQDNGLYLIAAYPINWTSGVIGASADTGLSRVSAGVVGVGTGAAGDFTGTLKLTTLQGGTTLTLNNAAAGTMTIGSNAVTPASTGTRYLCISTTGVVTSSALACSGT